MTSFLNTSQGSSSGGGAGAAPAGFTPAPFPLRCFRIRKIELLLERDGGMLFTPEVQKLSGQPAAAGAEFVNDRMAGRTDGEPAITGGGYPDACDARRADSLPRSPGTGTRRAPKPTRAPRQSSAARFDAYSRVARMVWMRGRSTMTRPRLSPSLSPRSLIRPAATCPNRRPRSKRDGYPIFSTVPNPTRGLSYARKLLWNW
jgi:hypothetical protein